MSEGELFSSILLYTSVQVVICLCYIPMIKIIIVDKTKSKLESWASIVASFTVLYAINSYVNYEIINILDHKEPELYETLIISFFVSLLVLFITLAIVKGRENKDPSEQFRSYKKDSSAFSTSILRDVNRFSNKDIAVYPRLIIFKGEVKDFDKKKIIFDSSDFEIISEMLETNNGKTKVFKPGQLIQTKSHLFLIEDVQVEYFNVLKITLVLFH
jgi:hypothetical protein